MISTRFGSEVKITEARLIPVWIERKPGEFKWHYSPPKKPKGKVEEMPIWFCKAHYRTDSPAPRSLEWLCDRKWVRATSLVADDGWNEIEKKLIELNLDHHLKYQAWNLKDAPEASSFFEPISEKLIA